MAHSFSYYYYCLLIYFHANVFVLASLNVINQNMLSPHKFIVCDRCMVVIKFVKIDTFSLPLVVKLMKYESETQIKT